MTGLAGTRSRPIGPEWSVAHRQAAAAEQTSVVRVWTGPRNVTFDRILEAESVDYGTALAEPRPASIEITGQTNQASGGKQLHVNEYQVKMNWATLDVQPGSWLEVLECIDEAMVGHMLAVVAVAGSSTNWERLLTVHDFLG